MSALVLIEVGVGETRAALAEDDKLVQLAIERDDGFDRGADIFAGRVKSVSTRMKTAEILLPGPIVGMLPLKGGSRPVEGQAVVVQIDRAAHRLKGPRLSTDIALAGRFIIYRPHQRGIAFARGLAESSALARRWAKLGKLGGFTLRPPIEHANETAVEAEADELMESWRRVEAKAASAETPMLLHADDGPVLRLLRDAPKVERILVDDTTAAAKLKAELAPDLARLVAPWRGQGSIFAEADIGDQIAEALATRIELPGGTALSVEETEALVAIDVDVGGEVDLPAACRNAAEAIARQIRLRRLGGQIVVDFPRLASPAAGKKLLDAFRALLARDPEPIEFGGRTRLGLVELARRRRGPSLGEILGQARSTGFVPDTDTALHALLRGALADARARPGVPLSLSAPAALILRLEGRDAPLLDELRRRTGIAVELRATSG